MGCTYKFLCGGPGAPAFAYVAREHQDGLRQPIQGWIGDSDPFAMEQGYRPAAGIARLQSGTPPIVGLAGVAEGIRLVAAAGIERIRAKAVALTEMAVVLSDAWLAPHGVTLGSPRDPRRRGGHVTLCRADAAALSKTLIDAGVIIDYRPPDGIRVGLSPLSTGYEELWRAMDVMRERGGGSRAMTRPIEEGVYRDLAGELTYGKYLRLDELLGAQRPVSVPEHHDELLFIIQHQTSELWLKLLIHELSSAMEHIAADELAPALKLLARVKHIQRQLFEQWAVLETLTPIEYAEFRRFLGHASGFQSVQYRLVEFMLGNKDAEMLEVFAHDPPALERLTRALETPSLYDEFLRYLARHGHPVPAAVLERDVSKPYIPNPELVPVLRAIYANRDRFWPEYEMCEELVDIEESFQLWRFRHLKTVERIIGFKRGTGGSSGVGFLRQALDLTFFPELLQVRTYITA